MNKKDSQNKPLKHVASFLGIGAEMGIIIFLSNLLGTWLDSKYDKSFFENMITLAGVFLAMGVVIFRVNRFNRK